jgi:O-antigen/teichoic acid export membrane protein
MTPDRPARLFRTETPVESLRVYLPATLLSRIIGLSRGVILTWLMTPHEFGLLQIALLAVNVLNPVLGLGLNEGVLRYVPLYETRGELPRYLRKVVPVCLGVTAVMAGVALVGAGPLARVLFTALPGQPGLDIQHTPVFLGRMAVATTSILVVYFVLCAVLKGLRMYRAISLVELSVSIAFTGLAVAAAWAGWGQAEAVLASYLVAMLGISALFLPGTRAAVRAHSGPSAMAAGSWPEIDGPDASPPISAPAPGPPTDVEGPRDPRMVPQLLRYSIWAALAAVMWQLLQGYPLWYLQKVRGPAVAAVYGGIQFFTQAVVVGAVAVVVVVQTSVTKIWEAQGPPEADRRWLLAFKATNLLMIGGCTLVAVLAPVLIRLFPFEYRAGAAIIPRLLLFFLIAAQLLFVAIHFHLLEKTRHLFVPWTAGVAGHVVFTAWWVGQDAGPAAALGMTAWAAVGGMTSALLVALVLVVMERRPLDRGSWSLLVAGYGLALPGLWPLVTWVILVVVLWSTQLILGAHEKAEIRTAITAGWRLVRGHGQAGPAPSSHRS